MNAFIPLLSVKNEQFLLFHLSFDLFVFVLSAFVYSQNYALPAELLLEVPQLSLLFRAAKKTYRFMCVCEKSQIGRERNRILFDDDDNV